MIIDPDMPDHWKTRMLVDLLGGDEMAPLYLIRLWGHCQNRKKSTFDSLPPAGLKALCRFQGDAQAFNDALVECGFVERDGNALIVCGWDEHNASLVKNWENGKKGGRPRKETPKENPEETQKKPNENPDKTQSEPSDNPDETHSGIGLTDREEKRREERKNTSPQTPQGGLDFSSWPERPSDQVLTDWLAMRKRQKANVSQTVVNRLSKELHRAHRAGYSVDDCLAECVLRNWRGFELEWIAKGSGMQGGGPAPDLEVHVAGGDA